MRVRAAPAAARAVAPVRDEIRARTKSRNISDAEIDCARRKVTALGAARAAQLSPVPSPMRLVSSPLALLLALLLPLCRAIYEAPTAAPTDAPTPAPSPAPDFFGSALFDFYQNLWAIFDRFWDILNAWPQFQYNMTP